jgi:hypothetical protein
MGQYASISQQRFRKPSVARFPTYHLIGKEHSDRCGPALCESKPWQRVQEAESSIQRKWVLQPLDKKEEPNEQRTCPLCLVFWKELQTGEVSNAEGNRLD